MDRFESTAITTVSFYDDPGIRPGHHSRSTVDTVELAGTGRWNGKPGYTFRALAADAGKPGRDRDRFSITIRDSAGAIVSSVTGTLSEGNIQSQRGQK